VEGGLNASCVDLTSRQRDVLAFINAFRSTEQCNPTNAEIAAHFGWRSPNASHEFITALGRKGVVSFRPGRSRGYVVNSPWSFAA
jgi:repressor LexA